MKAALITVLCALISLLHHGHARADGAKAEIKSVSVPMFVAGKTIKATLFGDNLAPTSVNAKAPLTARLISVKPTDEKTKAKGNSQVEIEVAIPAACPAENYELTLTQPGAALKTELCIVPSAANEIAIKKPAGTFRIAMPLPAPPCAVTGQMDGDTADIVKFEAKQGDVWDIRLTAGRGGSAMDPIVRIRDGRRVPLALSAGDKKRDRVITFRAPSDGLYYIEITDADAKGGGDMTYRLSVARRTSGN